MVEATSAEEPSTRLTGTDEFRRRPGTADPQGKTTTLRDELAAAREERETTLLQHEGERQVLLRTVRDSRERLAATQRDAEHLRSQLNVALADAEQARAELNTLRSSTMWRATRPVRQIATILPPAVKVSTAWVVRVAWWSVTLQLPRRLRLRQAALAALRAPQPEPPPIAAEPPAAALLPPAAPVTPPTLPGVDQSVAMIIDQVWPQPDRDAASIDAVNMTELLIQLGYRVVFAALNPLPDTTHHREALARRGAHCFGPDDAPSVAAYITDRGKAISLFVLTRYDAGGQFHELIRAECPHARIIFNTVGLHFLREDQAALLAGDAAGERLARRTRDREQFLALRSDATLVASTVGQAVLTAAVPGATVVLLPPACAGRPGPVPPFAARRNIGFVGDYGDARNVDAVRFFLAAVWPLVRDALPECWFTIAGSDLPDGVVTAEHEHVIYQGHVADLEGWFDGLRLTVAPIRCGAGLTGKVVSSMAAGVPCVGTALAMEGIPIIPGGDALVGEEPDQIAGELIRLYRDPVLWARLSETARATADAAFSPAGNRRRLLDCLIGLGLPCLTPPDTP